MKVRPARSTDVPALAEIAAASYRLSFHGILGEEGLAQRGIAFFTARFAAEWTSVSVMERSDGTLAGFAQVSDGMLHMLFVAPGATGAGVGASLLAHAERIGATRLECFRDNGGARRFYERHGWRLDAAYQRDFIGALRAFVAYAKP